MMGVTAVLSLQWCLRGTMKTPLATWKNGPLEKKQKHHDDDGGEGCPVSAVVSQGNFEVTNGHLERKQKHHDDDGDEGCPVSAVVSQGNYEVTNGHLEKKNRNIMMMMGVRAVLSLQWCLRGTMKVKNHFGQGTIQKHTSVLPKK